MLTTVFLAVAFVLLALPLIPSARLQQMMLGFAGLLLRLALVGVIGLMVYLAFPLDQAPHPAEFVKHSPQAMLAPMLPTHAPAAWLVLAAVMVVASLPLLAVIDFARGLAGHSVLLKRLQQGRRASRRPLREMVEDEEVASMSRQRKGELRAALEATGETTSGQRRRLDEVVS